MGFRETRASDTLRGCRKGIADDVKTRGQYNSKTSPGETCVLPGRSSA